MDYRMRSAALARYGRADCGGRAGEMFGFSSRWSSLALAFTASVDCVMGDEDHGGYICSGQPSRQIFYVYRPRPPAFRYVPIVRGSGVSEQGPPLFGGLSLTPPHARPYKGHRGPREGVQAPMSLL